MNCQKSLFVFISIFCSSIKFLLEGFETEPRLPATLAPALYDVILNNNLNPAKVTFHLYWFTDYAAWWQRFEQMTLSIPCFCEYAMLYLVVCGVSISGFVLQNTVCQIMCVLWLFRFACWFLIDLTSWKKATKLQDFARLSAKGAWRPKTLMKWWALSSTIWATSSSFASRIRTIWKVASKGTIVSITFLCTLC